MKVPNRPQVRKLVYWEVSEVHMDGLGEEQGVVDVKPDPGTELEYYAAARSPPPWLSPCRGGF